jgi:hypothetical protein
VPGEAREAILAEAAAELMREATAEGVR